MTGQQDFTGQQDGRTFMEQRTSLNRTSLDGRSSLDNRTSLDGRPLLEHMVERCLLEYADVQLLMCVRMWNYVCKCQCGLICMFVWRGVAGGTEFLVRNDFLFWEYLCVILCELNCKLLCCSETVFCIMSLEGRASLDGGTSLEGKILLEDRTLLEDRVPGGQDLAGGEGPWRTGLHWGTQ